MANNIIKRISILVFGIVAFITLLTSTMIKSNLDETFIQFKMFKSQFYVNSFRIMSISKNSAGENNEENKRLINELDLAIHVVDASPILFFYRIFDEDFDMAMTQLQSSWTVLMTNFFNEDETVVNNPIVSVSAINKKNSMLESMFVHLENRVSIIYLFIVSINLFAFLFLLAYVFYIENREKNSGSSQEILSVRNALIQGQEQERLRISLELHDKVAQDLFACKMIVNDLASTATDEDLKKSFEKAMFLVDSSIKEVRDLSYSLRPPALQAIGLDSAINSYIDNFSKKIDTPIFFKAIGVKEKNFEESISINLYRILQETLNNTAKHAHATNIDIKLIYTYPFLLLKIEDDGVGFKYVKSEMKATGRNKLGLPGIIERVSMLGGELIINTNKGEGTKILIKVPTEGNEKS